MPQYYYIGTSRTAHACMRFCMINVFSCHQHFFNELFWLMVEHNSLVLPWPEDIFKIRLSVYFPWDTSYSILPLLMVLMRTLFYRKKHYLYIEYSPACMYAIMNLVSIYQPAMSAIVHCFFFSRKVTVIAFLGILHHHGMQWS